MKWDRRSPLSKRRAFHFLMTLFRCHVTVVWKRPGFTNAIQKLHRKLVPLHFTRVRLASGAPLAP
jgi:hypothetical protein